MRIKVLKSCFTPRPVERSWTEGETVEVDEEKGRQLLNSSNFIEAEEITKESNVNDRKKK